MQNILVIGQGIAGTVIGHVLQQRGLHVHWIDQPGLSNASKVASGLYNPVVLKRMRMVHLAAQMMDYVDTTYRKLESITGKDFFYPTNILRIFHSAGEQNDWDAKSELPGWKSILGNVIPTHVGLKTPHGLGIVQQTGWVNTPVMLEAFRKVMSKHIEEDIVHAKDIVNNNGDIAYRGKVYDAVIFAEGWLAAKENPLYPPDIFRPSKGELINVSIDEKKLGKDIIHFKHFLIPLPEKNQYRIGATYVHGSLDEKTTRESADELVNSLQEICTHTEDLQIIEQKAGIRAAVKDRRPLIGQHPTHKKVFFFNGLGSRSILMAPYLAHCLAGKMCNDDSIPATIDIKRFYATCT